MVGDDAEADIIDGVGGVGGAVAGTGELLGNADDRRQQVGLVDIVDTLQDAGDTLDAHTGVDVLLRQLTDRVVALLRAELAPDVLHEDQVPDLDEPVLIGHRAAVGTVLRAAVVEDLRAGATGARDAHVPVVVFAVAALDPLGGHTDLVTPDAESLVVGEEDGGPQPPGVNAQAALGDRGGQQ